MGYEQSYVSFMLWKLNVHSSKLRLYISGNQTHFTVVLWFQMEQAHLLKKNHAVLISMGIGSHISEVDLKVKTNSRIVERAISRHMSYINQIT